MARDITIKNVENMALYYLERYNASTAHFKQVMTRKIKRRCIRNDIPYKEEEYTLLVINIAEKLQKLGYLNDDAYIKAIIKSSYNNGASTRKIRAKLLSKGIVVNVIDNALEQYSDNNNDIELHAGIKYIKKKKLGCYATTLIEEQKVLQRLAYAGYSYDMAKKLLSIDKDEADSIFYR